MAAFVWLEGALQEKEESKFVAMECGELSMVEAGTVLTPRLFVDSSDYSNHTQVIFCRVTMLYLMTIVYTSNRRG